MKKIAIVLATALLMSSGAWAQTTDTLDTATAGPNDGTAGATGITVSSSGTYSKATGGNGGNGKSNTAGSGGAGGVGIKVIGTPTFTVGKITGGAGGTGGKPGNVNVPGGAGLTGGNGGNGGVGISGLGFTVTNIATVTGGNGGTGGTGGDNLSPSHSVGGVGGNGGNGGAGIQVLGGTANITNYGTIQGGAGGNGGSGGHGPSGMNSSGSQGNDASGVRIFSGATANITNLGTINGGGNAPDILNQGIIGTLTNAQGMRSGFSPTPLTYSGKLPSNYYIISNSAGYGQLLANGVTGSMTFGIASGSTIPITSGLRDVLMGFSSSNLNNLSGTYNGYRWDLVAAGTGPGNYTLRYGPGTAPTAASTASTANTDVTTTVASGNNLTVSNPSTLGTGTVALVGSATVPATITTTGNMTINNNITVANDPVFNIAKGTTATVTGQITDASTPSAPGATVTGISGDVVVSGGGTLNLQAANTYTGLTSIDAGSTLALSSLGSIANSVSVTNNGKFDITSVGPTVSVNNYTQTSTGNLAMNNGQQLNVNGKASLAGGLALNGTSSLGKTPLITTTNGVTGKFNSITATTPSAINVIYTPSEVDLITYSFNTADVQQSLVNNVSVLQGVYTLQNTVLANSFSYDCNLFGANNVCVSAGGRYTGVSRDGVNNDSGLLIGAYRVNDHVRVGGYVDQNLSSNTAGVKLGNNTPLVGVFGVWSQRTDSTGTEVKISAATGNKDATVTRGIVNGTEPGVGSSTLTSRGAQVTAKYGFAVTEKTIVAPYAGVRYTQNNMGGYTENTSAAVTAPLTYSALNTNATTALAGVGATHKVTEKLGVYGSAGVESDTHAASGTYTATGLVGLTSINFNANPVKTRPTATLGTYYDVAKNQRVALTGIYRQEAFQGISTKTALATYTVGF